jgi:GcrA cell cycle regulator
VTWTDDQVKLLEMLAHEGWSCRQIGDQLGVSRNAVIGKLHRLGPTVVQGDSGLARPAPWRHPRYKRHRVAKPKPVAPPYRPPKLNQRVTVFELTATTCRWPLTASWPFYFCGAVTEDGCPYCPEHHQIARA